MADRDRDRVAEADAIAEIAREGVEAQVIDLGTDDRGSPIFALSMPEPTKLVSVKKLLDEYRTRPERRAGVAKMTTLESFIAHANRFKDGNSALFADDEGDKPKLLSVLDYHHAGGAEMAAARFGTHRGLYAFPMSEEWRVWRAQEDKGLSQEDFATFLEDRVVDMLDPSLAFDAPKAIAAAMGLEFAAPARIVALARSLSVRVNSAVAQAVKLSSGETQLTYRTEHTDERGQPLNIPKLFLIGIPIFSAGLIYQLPVKLRYRINGGAIVWSYELVRAERSVRDAVQEAAKKAETETELPLYFGTPEA